MCSLLSFPDVHLVFWNLFEFKKEIFNLFEIEI